MGEKMKSRQLVIFAFAVIAVGVFLALTLRMCDMKMQVTAEEELMTQLLLLSSGARGWYGDAALAGGGGNARTIEQMSSFSAMQIAEYINANAVDGIIENDVGIYTLELNGFELTITAISKRNPGIKQSITVRFNECPDDEYDEDEIYLMDDNTELTLEDYDDEEDEI
jgi:hypothetical protein